MKEQILIWALGIMSTFFGGLNIFQWFTLRSYKRIKSAEADKQEIENLRLIVTTIQASTQAEIGRLSQRVEDAERRATENANKYETLKEKYDALQDRYDELKDEFDKYRKSHK